MRDIKSISCKKAGVAILILDKTDIKTKTVTKAKEKHHIMIKGSIQEDITLANLNAFQSPIMKRTSFGGVSSKRS